MKPTRAQIDAVNRVLEDYLPVPSEVAAIRVLTAAAEVGEQVEAARKMLQLSSCFGREVCTLMPCACAETMVVALTAAAEVGPKPFTSIECIDAAIAAEREACAKVADSMAASPGYKVAAAIRARKDKP